MFSMNLIQFAKSWIWIRSDAGGAGDRVLNQILTEMDVVDTKRGFVI
jgi:SpoVK/Ycf46/Vps4 family AAA+-type ATPase